MPDLNLASKIGKEDYAKHEGEVQTKDGRQFKVLDKEQEYVDPKSKKSTNLFQGTNNAYLNLISKNKAYYNEDGSAKSAQQINMLTGINKIHPDKFKEYNDLVGYTPEKEIVFTDETIDREIPTTEIPEDNGGGNTTTGDVPEGGGGSVTYTVSDGDGDGKRWFKNKQWIKKHPKIKGDGLKECSSDDPTACGLDMAKQLKSEEKAETKAYKKAQRDRIYRTKKDGTQVLKKQFAPGQWFNEKMDNFKDKRITNQAKKDQSKRQKEINKVSKKRKKQSKIEYQHEHSDRYNKVDNFFNELAYKKVKKKKRIVKGSF